MKTLVQCISQRDTIINTEKEATVQKLQREIPWEENKLIRNLEKIKNIHEDIKSVYNKKVDKI